MLEAEAQHNPMLSPEDIKISKGEDVKVEKRVFPLIESASEYLLVKKEGYTVAWLYKWYCCNQQEK